jgi:hypothetical protein
VHPDPAPPSDPPATGGRAPALPIRASIYIDPDGTVHFGALFQELVPVARSLAGSSPSAPTPPAAPPPDAQAGPT